MSRRPNASRDVHVSIGRLVIDRAVLDTGSVEQLKEHVIDRITSRFANPTNDRADRIQPASRWDAADAIADAVVSRTEAHR